MSKKLLIKEIIGYVEKMENNTFLLPNSWSEEIQMATKDIVYRTYVGNRGANNRYINIDIVDGITINICRDTVYLENCDLSQRLPKLAEIRDVVKAIYEEKHSFADAAEGLASIRKEITQKRKDIKQTKEQLDKLNKRLQDYLATKPNKAKD